MIKIFKPRKILYIIPEYPPHFGGGIATFYTSIIPEIVSQGYQVDILVSNAFTSAFSSYRQDNFQVNFLNTNLIKDYLKKFDIYKAFPKLQRHLSTSWAAWKQVNSGEGYDLVETTDWGMLFVPWVVMEDTPPLVVQLHASIGQIDFHDPFLINPLEGHITRLLEFSLLSAADEIQTYSEKNVVDWQQITGKYVKYIPPALPLLSGYASQNTDENGLVVGRIQYWKGATTLCEALEQMGEDAPNINWVGRDVTYQALYQPMSAYLCQNYPEIWGQKIHPLGVLPPEKTRQLQSQAPFILVPSIWDVFNYTCAEAMALARPVVCSKGAGASDLIEDGVNGFTFVPDDPVDLALALCKVMSLSEQERQSMGEAARLTIETQLNPVKVAQQRIEVYENLIQCGKSPQRPSSWLVDAVSTQKTMANPLAFLDQLPLSELTQYLGQRFLKKVLKKS